MECNDYNESGKMNHHVFQPYPHFLPSYEEKNPNNYLRDR